MSGEVIVDALPYIDQGYDDPGVREAALAMVEEECRRYRPTKNYLENAGPEPSTAFETAALQREMERVQQRLPMEPLSMKRYELPPPPVGRLGEPTAWAEAVDNSHAQLSHQATRVLNLELQLQYSTEAWRSYLHVLQALVVKSQNVHAQLRKQIAAVNWERKRSQTASGARLRALRRRWAQLVADNYRLERALLQLQQQREKAKGQTTADDETPDMDMEAVKNLPDKLNSETEKEVQKKIEDMFAD
ncbi:pre-mRNA-splicing factor SPF27-like [Danaus plexippus]|uniref:Pre-mRNA-splicing factor SPF27 n=1 Tax=Danaus plexippus plexippus TaxID=278856 RepID=A0A212F208_DANPL|nr:pre-mRNA-splicing factor SPF27 [Danaus plexippus]XP_061380910.1 pre-mRNA-splicing factor SPF27-like [Danaus plexippus]OWR47754.1 pre-mRNA-splicing factor SPF27 like protein [Danaus plexippus plexippus]